jgi:branched-chain amino acid transport system substrate-binding protein
MLWAEAVKKAGTADQAAVIKAFNSGTVSYDAPSGKVLMDAKTHATTRDVFLVYADMDHSLTFPKTWEQFVPDWLSTEMGVDLSTGEDIGYKPAYTPQD